VLEAIHRLHEADVALLHEIEQGEVAAEVALGHRHDKPEVRLHELELGVPDDAVALLDLGQELKELTARKPALTLEGTELAVGARGAVALGILGHAVDALTVSPHVGHDLVDE